MERKRKDGGRKWEGGVGQENNKREKEGMRGGAGEGEVRVRESVGVRQSVMREWVGECVWR
jgi:hypothetical protein